MRIVVILMILAAHSASAAGFQDVTIPDPGHPPIAAAVWYPSDAPTAPQRIELSSQAVAPNAAARAGRFPLIVISHGQAGSSAGHFDTAIALADAGFVVVAPTHTGDNWRDQSGVMNIMDRPRQVSQVLDFMLASWPGRAGIDPARIGIFGYSAGGFTALVAIGGRPDFAKVGPYCAAHPAQYTCTLVAAHPTGVIPAAGGGDPRIKAAVIAAPALAFAFMPDGLRAVRVPVQLWRADDDKILPPADYADAVRFALPQPPEFHPVPNAGHFDFLAPCSAALASTEPMICTEAPGFDRVAFHHRFNDAIVAFFRRTLPVP